MKDFFASKFKSALNKLSNKQKHKLENCIIEVKQFLNSKECDVPFYIGGGFVFSILMKNEIYSDIDIFFYKEEDLLTVKQNINELVQYKTNNAITLSYDIWSPSLTLNHPSLQLVCCRYGTPEKMFKSFDLNCSRCAFTSDNELITDDCFNRNVSFLEVDFNNDSPDLLKRYHKYIVKGAVDKTNEYAKILHYYIENIDKVFKYFYSTEVSIKTDALLYNEYKSCPSTTEFERIVEEHLRTNYESYELIEKYNKFQYMDFEYINEELLVSMRICELSNLNMQINPDLEKSSMMKYPEYFI